MAIDGIAFKSEKAHAASVLLYLLAVGLSVSVFPVDAPTP